MSAPVQTPSVARPFQGTGRTLGIAMGVGLVGLGLTAWGFVVDPKQAAFSYLIAYAYVFSIALGAMAFLLAVTAMGATWPTAIRRLPEAIVAVFPLLAVLFVPIALSAHLLYPWMHPNAISDLETRRLLEHKLAYLNLPFALIRLAVFFTFWIALGAALRRWSLGMTTRERAQKFLARMQLTSQISLFFFVVFTTVTTWDWLMSLSPDWVSTAFGLYFLSGGFLAAIGAVTLLAVLARRAGYLTIGDSHRYALGRLLLAFLVFWAYVGYFQYMLTWIANRPVEAKWFLARTSGQYRWVAYFLTLGHFALPFLVLLLYRIKRSEPMLRALSIWLLFAHYFDVHWVVAAARERANPFAWQDAAALACVVGLSVAFGLWRQRGVPLAAVDDPRYAAALEYHSR